MRSNSEHYRNAGLFWHHFSSMFIIFSASISVSICSSFFDGRWLPPNGLSRSAGCSLFLYFSQPFPKIYVFMHFGRPVADFWHPWASKWLTFGSPWLPFGSLWAPFGSLLIPFGSLWLTFGTLFEEIMKTFINSIHFHEFARLVNIFYDFSYFSQHHC